MFPIQDSVPSRSVPVVTRALILINAIVFFFELSLPQASVEQLFYLFGIVPARFTHPDWAAYVGFPVDSYWPFLTHQFLHGGWLHIIFNMWPLWIFGDNEQDRMGPLRVGLFSQVVRGKVGVGGSENGGGMGWWAHVGGFVGGMLLCGLFVRRRRPAQPDEYGLEWAWEPRRR